MLLKNNSLVFLIFLSHLILINLLPVNFEHTFSEFALEFFANPFQEINNYYKYQANTISFPLIVAVIKIILPFLNEPQIAKLIPSFASIFLCFGVFRLSKIYSIKDKSILVLLISLNPFLWTMGHRGTPDFISPALAIFAMSYLILNTNIPKKIFFSFLLGIAILIKPITGIILIFINIHHLLRNDFNFMKVFKNLFIINFVSLFFFTLYLIFIYYNFNFFLTPHYYKQSLIIDNLHLFFNNLILYIGYTYMLIIPLRLNSLFTNFRKKDYYFNFIFFLFAVAIFFVGKLYLIPQLELNLSFISKIIGRDIEVGVYTFCFALFLIDCLFNKTYFSLKKKIILPLFLTLITYFLIISFFSPSQRYIIVIVPFFYLIFFIFSKNTNYVLCISLYIFLNLLLLLNQYINGKLSRDIVDDLKKTNLITLTCPGVIEAHAGNFFEISNKECIEPTYHVVYGNRDKKILFREIKILFFSKSLSVINY